MEKFIKGLNKLCYTLDDKYNINSGGCAFVAMCIANELEKRHEKFRVMLYQSSEFGNNFDKFKKSSSCTHVAIFYKNTIINNCGIPPYSIRSYYRKSIKVTASELSNYYINSTWNSYYETKHNSEVSRAITTYFNKNYTK